jgi:hypothetical protein
VCQKFLPVIIKPRQNFHTNGLVLLIVCICQLSWDPPSADPQIAQVVQYSSYTCFSSIQLVQQFFDS